MARYGQVDFNDRDVQGGAFQQWYFAVNWWATKRWKVALGYGTVNLRPGQHRGVDRYPAHTSPVDLLNCSLFPVPAVHGPFALSSCSRAEYAIDPCTSPVSLA